LNSTPEAATMTSRGTSPTLQFTTDEHTPMKRAMSRKPRRLTLSGQDSHTLEPRHLLTAVTVGLSIEVAPLPERVGMSIGHAVTEPAHNNAFALTTQATPTVVSPHATSAWNVAAAPKTFNSLQDAAIDWGNSFNGESITCDQEYGSSFYQNPDGTYSYSDPAIGTDHVSVTPSSPPNGQALAGVIHSHAAYNPTYGEGNFHFSPGDIAAAKASKVPEYMTNPRGELLLYDLGTGNEVLISTSMPKDPNSP